MTETFTATAICPECGSIDIHWLDQPRTEPKGDSPVEQAQRRIASMHIFPPGTFFDPPGAAVARICRNCNHRWGQR